MTKTEAIEAMKRGEKVTHQYFTQDEWVTMKGNRIVFEDGVNMSPDEYWAYREGNGWKDEYSIVKN
jgi:hypothetical protein